MTDVNLTSLRGALRGSYAMRLLIQRWLFDTAIRTITKEV
jgi:hypothetical protein